MGSGSDEAAIHEAEERVDAIQPAAGEEVRTVNDGTWTQEELAKAEGAGVPVWDGAIEAKSLDLGLLVGAYKQAFDPSSNRIAACVAARYLPLLRRAFEEKNQGITRLVYLADYKEGLSCALTGNDEIHISLEEGTPSEAGQLATQALELSDNARRHLKSEDTTQCNQLLFGSLAFLTNPKFSAETAKSELNRAEKFFERSVNRQSMLTYFQGMLIGASVLAPAIAVVGFLLWFFPVAGMATSHVIGALVGGALGGFVSVLTRMTSGSLELDYGVGERLTKLFGAFRPVIGALFGFALFVLVDGSWLNIRPAGDAVNEVTMFVGLGFLAGFSERWAQDMLSRGRPEAGRQEEGDNS